MGHSSKSRTRTVQRDYESWGQFVADAESRPDRDGWNDQSMARRNIHQERSLSAAIERARFGWKEGAALMIEGLEATDSLPHQQTNMVAPSWDYDIAGAVPDVAAFCAGEPEHMATPDEEHQNGQPPVVRVFVNLAAPQFIEKQQKINYGVAILSYVNALQTAGYGVELRVFTANKDRRGLTYITAVPVNDPAQALDIDRAAFALAHTDMQRRLCWALREMDDEARTMWENYGTPTDFKPDNPDGAARIDVPMVLNVSTEADRSPGAVAEKLRPYFRDLLDPEEVFAA